MTRFGTRALIPAMALLSISALAPARAAADPLDGKIVVSNKRIPTSGKSKSAYFAAVRKQSQTQFWEDKGKKSWKIYYGAFFKRPLNDLEVTIKIYEAGGGPRRLVASFEQFLDGRGQKNIISYITLERKKFGVNKQLVMNVENRGQVLATGKFKILGEAEKFSGKADFSKEEAESGAEE